MTQLTPLQTETLIQILSKNVDRSDAPSIGHITKTELELLLANENCDQDYQGPATVRVSYDDCFYHIAFNGKYKLFQ